MLRTAIELIQFMVSLLEILVWYNGPPPSGAAFYWFVPGNVYADDTSRKTVTAASAAPYY
jgi:hypothetical protein